MKTKYLPINLLFSAAIIFCSFLSYAQQDEIRIGWIGPLSGDASVLGVDSVEVIRQVFDQLNAKGGIEGKKIRLFVEDDQYQTSKTVSAYNKLVHLDRVQAIFVITYGGLLAVARKAEADNVLLVDTLDCDDELAALPKNTFCTTKRTEDLGIENARQAVKNNDLPAAIIYFDADPFMPKVARVTQQQLEQAGQKVSLFEGISGSAKDFRSLLTRIKAMKVKSIFIYGYDDFALLMRQAREMGIESQFYALASTVNSPGFKAAAGNSLNGARMVGWMAPRTEQFKAFINNYKERIGREPIVEVVTIPSYDMARVMVSCFEKGAQIADSLRECLYSLKDYQGLSGNLSMDADGAVRTLKVRSYRIEQGNLIGVND